MGHPIKLDNFPIMDNESQYVTRTIKEAMFIRANDSSLNRNLGKCQLPHIWDEVLQDTPVLHQQGHSPCVPSYSHMGPLPPHNMGHTHLNGNYGPPMGAFPPPASLLVPNFAAIFWHQKGGY